MADNPSWLKPRYRRGTGPGLFVMRGIGVLVMGVLLCLAAPAKSDILVNVDKSQQRLTVVIDGFTRYQWPVSTARRGYRTPNGSYRPQWLARQWFSTIYDGSPMTYSIFFNGGYAIHGTHYIKRLGTPASHGCVRLHPDNAATLFSLVEANGIASTQIIVEQ